MDNIIYIYDASTARLVVTRVKNGRGELDEHVERFADKHGMRWNDCAWGGVDAISINI